MNIIVRIRVVIFAAAVVVVAGLLLYLRLSFQVDAVRQKARVRQLESFRAVRWDEARFADFPLDGELRLDEIQLVATHNSYHVQPDPLRLFLIGLVEPEEADALRYTHEPLWDQLDAGIRGFELDVRYKRDRFEIVHVPLVGNRGTCPDFTLALREIRLWSDAHPAHLPIVVLFELKADWMQLDPGLRPFTAESLDEMDRLLTAEFPDGRLITPDSVRGTAPTLRDAVANGGWPPVRGLLGKVMFILHENEEYRKLYTSGRPSLEGRVMFTCSEPGEPDAAVMLRNDPNDAEIPNLVSAGYLVRTRADADLDIDATKRHAALASGAQIISTDYPPSEPQEETGYVVDFGGGRTVRKRPIAGR